MDNAGWWVGIAGFVTALTTAVVTIMKTRHTNKMEENSVLVSHWKDYAERYEKAVEDNNETMGKLVRMVMRQNTTLNECYHAIDRLTDWAQEATVILTNGGHTVRPLPKIPERKYIDLGIEAEFLAREVAQVSELLRNKPDSNPRREKTQKDDGGT